MYPITICSIFKNEALYIKEWLEFHIIQGVSKFYLYNHRSTDNYLDVLQPYINSGIVELIEWDFPSPTQHMAYRNHLKNHCGENIWTAFIDVDEFLFSPKYDNMIEALNNFSGRSLGVNWRCFGSNGEIEYDPRPVIERFTMATTWANMHIKSVLFMNQWIREVENPHYFFTENTTVNENNIQITGPFSEHSSNIFRINHYWTKSKNEWYTRAMQPTPDRVVSTKTWDMYNACCTENVFFDNQIQKFLPKLKNKLDNEIKF